MRPTILNALFNDDRMFVLELLPATNRTLTSSTSEKRGWAVITRRNVMGYPPYRSDSFETSQEAEEYYKRIVLETPRLSLGEKSPSPIPTLEDYTSWLEDENLFDPVLNPEGSAK